MYNMYRGAHHIPLTLVFSPEARKHPRGGRSGFVFGAVQ